MSQGPGRGPRTGETAVQQEDGRQRSNRDCERSATGGPESTRRGDADQQPPDRAGGAGQRPPSRAGQRGSGHGPGSTATGPGAGGPAGPGRGTARSRSTGGGTVPTLLRAVPITLAAFGLPTLYVGLVIMQAGEAASRYNPAGGGSAITLAGLFSAGLGVGYLAAAYGTWTLRPWGWKLAVTLFGLGALSSAVLVTGDVDGPGLFGLLLNGGLGWYLYANRPLYRRLSGTTRG